jgi:hypothetical protein
MNTQKGKGKEMKKLSCTMPIPFPIIYAQKFDSVLKMKIKYIPSVTHENNKFIIPNLRVTEQRIFFQ